MTKFLYSPTSGWFLVLHNHSTDLDLNFDRGQRFGEAEVRQNFGMQRWQLNISAICPGILNKQVTVSAPAPPAYSSVTAEPMHDFLCKH